MKAEFLNGDMFVGNNQLANLTKIKTKNELIGEVIGLLMSPIQRVIGALQNRPETTEAPAAKTEAAEDVKAEATPKVEDAAPKVEDAAPKAEEAAPKAEEAAPKAEEAAPKADDATATTEGAA